MIEKVKIVLLNQCDDELKILQQELSEKKVK